jgi:ribosome-associated protein
MPVKAFEGSQESQWLLIDQGDVMIHIFVGEARTVYDLDGLWKEAKMISVPEDFYFSSTQTTSSLSGEAEQFVTSSEDYF